jgi:hypothetical protein
MEQIVTAEEIARHYSALLDSVALINAGKQEGQTDEEWADCLARNQEHCRLMLAKDFWTTEDMSVVEAVV